MEKEVLSKIYMLRKIKPEKAWLNSTKDSILERGDFAVEKNISIRETAQILVNYLSSSVVQNGLVTAGAFAFLLIFGSLAFPLLPSNYDYQEYAYIPAPVRNTDAELKIVAEDIEGVVEVAEDYAPIKKEFVALENDFKDLRKQVLGVILDTTEEKEIAEGLIAQLEAEEAIVKVATVTKEGSEVVAKNKLERMKEWYEEEDYEKVIDIYFE
jgi:hypothetical protein